MISLKKIITNKTAKNAGWLIAGKIFQMVLSLFVGVLTARYLGPSNYGLVNYSKAYVSFFTSLCTLGINSILVKEFVDKREKTGEIIGTTLVLRAISSILSMIMIFGIVSILDYGETITIVVTVLCSIGILFNILETFNYWFQSILKSKFTAIATLLAYVIVSVYRIILMITSQDVYLFALAAALDYFAVGAILIIFYIVNKGPKMSFSFACAKDLLSKSWHFILPGLMVSIFSQTDKMMLKQFVDETEVGYYATALAICNMWVFILSAIIDSFYPSIMQLHKEGNIDLYEKRNMLLYCIVFYVSLIASTLITILSPVIVKILYGGDYMPSVNPLRIITWYTAFSFLGVARNAWVVCENKQKYLIWIYLASAIINVGLNLALIPVLGASGAALASLSAQILTTMIVPLFIKPLKENTILILKAIIFKFL